MVKGIRCQIVIRNKELFQITGYDSSYVSDFVLIQSKNTVHFPEPTNNAYPRHPGGTTILIHVYNAKLNITTHVYPECLAQPGLTITTERVTKSYRLEPGHRSRYLSCYYYCSY